MKPTTQLGLGLESGCPIALHRLNRVFDGVGIFRLEPEPNLILNALAQPIGGPKPAQLASVDGYLLILLYNWLF